MKAFHKTLAASLFVPVLALAGCSSMGARFGGSHSASTAAKPAAPSPSGLISELHGGIIGQKIGSQLSSSNRKLALEAEYRALEEAPGGKAVTWQSPNGKVSGTVVAAPPYQVGSQNCRQYTHTVDINGAKEVAKGAACRNKDGSWTPLT